MNTLQTIWSALTAPNPTLFKIITIPLTYLDAYIGMLFFSTILNIDITKKRKIVYVLVYGTLGNIMVFLVPNSYSIFVNLIVWPIAIFLILKAGILKSLLAEIITMVTTSILDYIAANILTLFGITTEIVLSNPIYRLGVALSIYHIM